MVFIVLAEVKHHFGWVLDVVFHQVWEPGDGGAVEHAVVGWPTNVDQLRLHNVSSLVESRQGLNLAQSSNGNLKQEQDFTNYSTGLT